LFQTKGSLLVTSGHKIEEVSDSEMARVVSIFIDKYSSDDSFLITLTFSDRILVQKIVSIKTREEEAESSSWKPPLFLIGIAIAFIYQVQYLYSGVFQTVDEEE